MDSVRTWFAVSVAPGRQRLFNGSHRRLIKGFTLIELLSVITIISVLAAAAMPLLGPIRGNELSSASRLVSNLMTIARTQAIARNTLTRFAVVTDWPGKPSAGFRLFSVWELDAGTSEWKQATKWEELPQSTSIAPTVATYAPGSSPGDYLTNGVENIFTTEISGATVTLRYIEYLPTGESRSTRTSAPETWLAIAPSTALSGTPANWSKISSNSLTGRLKITRP